MPDAADIITFIESPWGLNLRLYPVQRVLLKAHYGLALDDNAQGFDLTQPIPLDHPDYSPDLVDEDGCYKYRIVATDWRRQNEKFLTEADYLRFQFDAGRAASSAQGTSYQRPRPDTQQRRFSSYKEALITAANAFPTPNEDFDMLTRQGARRVTSMLDRLASAIQENPSILGINPKIAKDFAYRCDLLSDAIEGRAVANFPRQAAEAESDESDDESPKAEEAKKANLRTRMARLRRLAAESEDEDEADEADEAVAKKANRRQAQFDASTIGEEDMGPLEQLDSDEPWMDNHFTQSEFREVHNMAKSARRNHHGFRLTST